MSFEIETVCIICWNKGQIIKSSSLSEPFEISCEKCDNKSLYARYDPGDSN